MWAPFKERNSDEFCKGTEKAKYKNTRINLKLKGILDFPPLRLLLQISVDETSKMVCTYTW